MVYRAGILVIGMLIGGSSAQAQWCVDCHDEDYPCTVYEHNAPGVVPYSAYGPGPIGAHYECYTGTCYSIHGFCIIGDDAEEQLLAATLVRSVFEDLANALSHDDASTIGWLVRQLPRNIVFVPEKSSLLVVDCNGRVVANYLLRTWQLGWLLPEWISGPSAAQIG